jgi:hypothetical protein
MLPVEPMRLGTKAQNTANKLRRPVSPYEKSCRNGEAPHSVFGLLTTWREGSTRDRHTTREVAFMDLWPDTLRVMALIDFKRST